MADTGAVNQTLSQFSSSYQSYEKKNEKKSDELGRDTFLTMIVKKKKNQDPLNPMEGTDFSTQLAQFSQLEQLIGLNDSIESMSNAFKDKSQNDVTGYLGKEVTGNIDSIEVKNGTPSTGAYNLSQPAEVMISITNSEGKEIKNLYPGQKMAGAYSIRWDGTDNSGKQVEDGSYKYTVMADTGSGFIEVPTTVSGEVEKISYSNGKPYLMVNGMPVDPESLKEIVNQKQEDTGSIVDYLGKEVSSDMPLVMVDKGNVSGSGLGFELDESRNVLLNIVNSSGETVRSMSVPADETESGFNEIEWDGLDDTGEKVRDGVYAYTVTTASGGQMPTTVNENVTGIQSVNGNQYLVLDDSRRLVTVSSLNSVN